MGESQQHTVQEPDAGKTLAAFVRATMPGTSWGDARGHVHGRRVLVNDVVCVDDARRLRAGDRVELLGQPARPMPVGVRIVHEDQDLVIIEKPAGMECERRREQSGWSPEKRGRQVTVVEALQKRGYQVLPVHRLDRDTSGLMLYALTPPARAKLVAQLAAHEVERTYVAIAIGVVATQTVHNWIIRDRGDSLRGCVSEPRPGAQEAISHFRQLEVIAGKYTLLECQLQTGRTHQIRLHLSSLGHPICGEKLYRSRAAQEPPIEDASGAARHALHSARLTLQHPTHATHLSFEAPLPPDLARLSERLRTSVPDGREG